MDVNKRSAEKIVLASCILKGVPANIDFPCPFGKQIKKVISEKVQIETIDWTH